MLMMQRFAETVTLDITVKINDEKILLLVDIWKFKYHKNYRKRRLQRSQESSLLMR